MNGSEPIPEQQEGGQTDTTADITLNTVEEAAGFFKMACARLRNVNQWAAVCGSDATQFSLFGSEGQWVNRDAAVGDFFRIDIPGPGNTAGQGYDWVRVEEIALKEDAAEDIFFIRVRPAAPPISGEEHVAHFFKEEATSTFMIRRRGLLVSAEVHGRNEKPNTHSEYLSDKIRNTLVGAASLLGFSLPQWKMLVKGLVKPE